MITRTSLGADKTSAGQQPQTQYGDVIFPAESHVVHGSGRKHIHEYPHSPGGAPEKLGRGLWNVTIKGLFHSTFRNYPDLYPNGMNKIRRYYELQQTLTLVHPSIGSFPAFIVDYRQSKTARVRSGETLDLEFLEDQQTAFLVSATAQTSQATIIVWSQNVADLMALIRPQLQLRPKDIGLFTSLQNAANAVLAIKDTAALYGNLLAAKVDQLASLCAQVDALPAMQDPRAWPIVNALHELWSQTVKLANDLLGRRVSLQKYIVPRTASLTIISGDLYGDTLHSSDLYALNSTRITTPLAVPAGTELRYYPAAA